MNAPAFTKQFFKARLLARVAGVDAKTVRRKAKREGWPAKKQGARTVYRAPLDWMRKSATVIAPGHSSASILDQGETIRALDRAAAVNGFVRELQRDPSCGVEKALVRTVSNFRHLKSFSVRVLRRWINGVMSRGLGALHEHKIGRVGRRAGDLHKILK